MKTFSSSRLRALSPLLAMVALGSQLAACADDNETTPTDQVGAAAGSSQSGGQGGGSAGMSTGTGGKAAGGATGGTSSGGGGGDAGGSSGGTSSGGSGGSGGSTVEPPETKVPAGEECEDPSKAYFYFSPGVVHVAPGQSRTVSITATPDYCKRTAIPLEIAAGDVATMGAIGGAVPQTGEGASRVMKVDYGTGPIPVEIKGVAPGETKLKVSIMIGGKENSAELPIKVEAADTNMCSGTASGNLAPGAVLGASADVLGAELGLQANADKPAQTEVDGVLVASPTLWPVSAFDAEVRCAADIVPPGHKPLGAAITFGPEAKKFQRELPMAIPIVPSAIPDKATLRHVKVSYSGPAFKTPRTIPVADLRIEAAASGGYVLRFLAPRLGTYQAVIEDGAGTKTFKRKLTHRALLGVSMGGGGTAQFGMKHHDKFDVLAPLGGPVDWSYMMDQIQTYQVSGFPPNDGDTVPQGPPSMVAPRYVYEHPSMFNKWWYEYPREGNGGGFSRRDYTQIFRDLSLMYGNPNSQNDEPDAEHLPRGVPRDHASSQGDHTGDQCLVTVDPIDGSPTEAQQKELDQKCPSERCSHTLRLEKYYDRKFNPKGTWPVITVCDGSGQLRTESPYANTWHAEGNDMPLEVGLAVDYNDNGVRDENEPIITQGQEPYRDVGLDGVASEDEAGYEPGVNEDPAGDDYDPQYNPTGTERNGRYDEGEPFDDFGLDGVDGTKDSPYDLGEGDGKFTVTKGLDRFFSQDAHSIALGRVTPEGGKFDADAAKRVDIWTDGGTRDLFNFAVAAQTLTGSYIAAGRQAGYYNDFRNFPGQPEEQKTVVVPQRLRWDEMPGVVFYRYGKVDPTEADLKDGSGQHVGSGVDLINRLQSSFYFIGSRWPDAPRGYSPKSGSDPAPNATPCEIQGTCHFDFTDKLGRTGPVTVNVPPGYGHKDRQDVRYPVVYMLHGYGQTPEDLGAAITFLGAWMNGGADSFVTRMPKAIVVYVDGRCRIGPEGKPECIRGTFYADSPRPTGGKNESWFLDLMKEIDTRYRTMPSTEVDWAE